MFRAFISSLLVVSFILTSIFTSPDVFAQNLFTLPAPGTMVDFSSKFNQAMLKGIIFYPKNPFKFDFILDQGDSDLNQEESRLQSQKIAEYFLASLTTPEKQIWVNLSPFEKDRIIPAQFGRTTMGQNLLAQDYMLKQIMATAIYPEHQLGHEFWKKVYTQALIKFGTTNIKFNTFNKVWIVPDKAVVYENTKMNAVLVAQSSLKVLLENDYLAQNKMLPAIKRTPVLQSAANTMSMAVIKELVIPALEKEVNEGRNFAPLRQVYNALILAKWYKMNLRNSLIAKGYIDRNKIGGVKSQDPKAVGDIYQQYLKAYKKGVFNYIKEDFDEGTQGPLPRKYFSGGFMGAFTPITITKPTAAMLSMPKNVKYLIVSLLLAVSLFSIIYPANLQAQTIPSVSQLIAPPYQAAGPLTADQKENNLRIIEGFINGTETAESATRALRQIPDDSTLELDQRILRMSPGGSVDRVLKENIPNDTTITAGIGSGGTSSIGIAVGAISDLISNTISTLRERNNVGNTTMRVEAALDVERKAAGVNDAYWKRFFDKDIMIALNPKNETGVEAKAARHEARAAIIRAAHGNVPREFLGNAILGLDEAKKDALDPNSPLILKLAALDEILAVDPQDKDNRVHGMIDTLLRQAPDIHTAPVIAALAKQFNKTESVPTLLNNIRILSASRPVASDPQATRNWDAMMGRLIHETVVLGQNNPEVMNANLDAQIGWNTEAGSLDFFNYTGMAIKFAQVQANPSLKPAFIAQLNAQRRSHGLAEVKDIPITAKTGELKDYMDKLRTYRPGQGVKPAQIISDVLAQFGPIAIPEIIQAVHETSDQDVFNGFMANQARMSELGIYYPNNNPFNDVITAKLNSNQPGVVRTTIQGIAASGGVKNVDQARAAINFMYTQPMPLLDAYDLGQFDRFFDDARLVASAIRSWPNATALINQNARADASGEFIRQALLNGGNRQALMKQFDWFSADKLFTAYLNGDTSFGGREITPQRVADALENANNISRQQGASSGYTVAKAKAQDPVLRSSAESIKRMKIVFNLIANKKLKFEMLGWLLNSHQESADKEILAAFKDADLDQKRLAAHAIVDTYFTYLQNRNLFKSEQTVRTEAEVANLLRNIGVNALNEAINDKLNSSNISDDQRRALQALQQAPSSPEYTQAIITLVKPNATDAEISGALRVLSNVKQFPSFATGKEGDLVQALRMVRFNKGSVYGDTLIKITESANTQLAPSLSPSSAEEMREELLGAYTRRDHTGQKATAIRLFTSADADIAGDLFREGIRSLRVTYLEDQNHHIVIEKTNIRDYFIALTDLTNVIKDLKTTQPAKYQSIITRLHFTLQQEMRERKFDFDTSILYTVLESIDPTLISDVKFDFQQIKDDHFLNPPAKPGFTSIMTDDQIVLDQISLADNLTRINALAASFDPPSHDPLYYLEALLTPNHVGQLWAVSHNAELALTLQKYIPKSNQDTQMALLYLGNQYIIDSNDPAIQPPPMTDDRTAVEVNILAAGQYLKRGSQARQIAIDNLPPTPSPENNQHFSDTLSPSVRTEIEYQIGVLGGQAELYPVLNSLTFHHLSGDLGLYNRSHEGRIIEEAVKKMNQRDPNIVRTVRTYGDRLPISDLYLRHSLPLYNQAMLAVDKDGGIDFNDINIQDQKTGDISTAFDDKAQLSILLQSDGLRPVIEDVQPLPQKTFNQLLGLI